MLYLTTVLCVFHTIVQLYSLIPIVAHRTVIKDIIACRFCRVLFVVSTIEIRFEWFTYAIVIVIICREFLVYIIVIND